MADSHKLEQLSRAADAVEKNRRRGFRRNTRPVCSDPIKKQARERYNSKENVKERQREYARQKYRESGLERRRAIKIEAVKYLGGACEKCKGVFDPVCFDFHHVDIAEKKFDIAPILHYGFQAIKDELDKCVLVCANCHRLIHRKI